ncbi:NmrA/HSCARG family protein [Sporobolomyces salmoneus]|uniref:NmrA/HSCARG family protein n=1 Tax=Sporobolomyces salmoneus TaxID=183962 RepID=UPI00316C4509
MSSSPAQLLLVGASGKQGGATLNALLAAGHPPPAITCLTRNVDSPAAQKIKEKGCQLVKGSLTDIPSLKEALKGKDAAFLVTVIPEKGQPVEEEQGRNFISAASATNLPYLVFTSVASASPSCGIPHFESKARIEESLKDSGIKHSILRPVAFFDNWPKQSGVAQMMALGLFDAALKGKPLQMVSCDDIGHFAAQALLNPDKFSGRTIDLAGDELTMEQARQIYAEVHGGWLPTMKAWIPGVALLALPYDLRMMFYMYGSWTSLRRSQWFHNEGYKVSIPSVKSEHPALLTLEDWLRKKDDE